MTAMKPPETRQRRNRSTTARSVEAGPAMRPDLPAQYHQMTKVWWSTIWGSPIADAWVDADVPSLVALAQLVDDFWTAEAADRAKRHAEVRMASREFGLSPFSRRQLQWEIKKVESGRPPAPPSRSPRSRKPFSVLNGSGQTA